MSARDELSKARERGICPRCKDGNGRTFDGAGSRIDCPSCDGRGTWEAFALERAFTRGWNAALNKVAAVYGGFHRDPP